MESTWSLPPELVACCLEARTAMAASDLTALVQALQDVTTAATSVRMHLVNSRTLVHVASLSHPWTLQAAEIKFAPPTVNPPLLRLAFDEEVQLHAR